MTLESEELEVRKNITMINHMQNRTTTTPAANSSRKLPKEKLRELDSLLKQRSVDPFITVQLRESTVN
jgi:uncharacterized protein YbaP (TraB family)